MTITLLVSTLTGQVEERQSNTFRGSFNSNIARYESTSCATYLSTPKTCQFENFCHRYYFSAISQSMI
jgi:hypothetical protein